VGLLSNRTLKVYLGYTSSPASNMMGVTGFLRHVYLLSIVSYTKVKSGHLYESRHQWILAKVDR